VRLECLRELAQGLRRIASAMPAHERDASCDLLLFFDAAAEADWLARFRG
jgi:hypothetical protein